MDSIVNVTEYLVNQRQIYFTEVKDKNLFLTRSEFLLPSMRCIELKPSEAEIKEKARSSQVIF